MSDDAGFAPHAEDFAFYDPTNVEEAVNDPPPIDDLEVPADAYSEAASPSVSIAPVRASLVDTASYDGYAQSSAAGGLPAFDFDDALSSEPAAPKPGPVTRHVANLLDELGGMSDGPSARRREAELVQRMTLALPKDDLLQRLAELDRLKAAEDDLALQLSRLEQAAAEGHADLSQLSRIQNEWKQLNDRKTALMTEGLPTMSGSATEISSSSALSDDELLGSQSALSAYAEPVSSASAALVARGARSQSSVPGRIVSFDEDDVDAILSAAQNGGGSPRKLPGAVRPSPVPTSAPAAPAALAPPAARGRPLPTAAAAARPLPSAAPAGNAAAAGRGRGSVVPAPGLTSGSPAPGARPAGAASVPHYACTLCKKPYPKSQLSLVRQKPFCQNCKARLQAQAKQRGMQL